MIGLYLELLEEGSLDENLIPEIEGVFKEVGALAGLDFETIRKELGEGAKKKKHAGGRPRNVIKDDALLIADLPDPFGWKDVAAVWSISRSKAFKRLAKLVEKDLVYPAGPGSYRVTSKSPETQKKKSPQTQEPSPQTQKKKSPQTQKPQKTAKSHKTTRKEPSPQTQKRGSPQTQKPSPQTQKKESPQTQVAEPPPGDVLISAESLHIESYNEKSIVLRGDTKPLKDQIEKKVSVANGTASCEAGRVGSSA